MEAHPPAWDDLPWLWGCLEPSTPPGLNREQAWAWAMDNFPALCRPSREASPESVERSRGAHGQPRRVRTSHVDVPGARRGQKRCRDPRAHDPKAESAQDPQVPRGDTSAASQGHTEAPGATLSPSRPHKRPKNHA